MLKGKNKKIIREKNDGQNNLVNRKHNKKISKALPREKRMETIREEISILVVKI
jgi:hypothetical protein